MNKREIIMKEAPVKKALLSLAVPSVLAMVVMALYNFIDTLFVGMLNDTNAMAGVSIGFPLMIIIMAFGMMVGIGASTLAGRKLGSGDVAFANRTAGVAVKLAVGLAVWVTVVGLLFLNPIMQFMGATPEVLPYATTYSSYMLLGAIFTIINMCFNNLLRAEGAAQLSMVTLMIGALLNIILDPLFMFEFGLNMGLAGAAAATVLSQGVSTVFVMTLYMRKKTMLQLNKENIFGKKPEDKEIVSSIIQIGLPVFLMQTLTSVAAGLLNTGAAAYGAAPLAALGIVNKIYMIVQQVLAGYTQAFLPFTAYNVGAKRFDRVSQGLKFSLMFTVCIGILSTILLNVAPEPFVKIFTSDQQVVELGVNALKAQTYLLGATAFVMIMTSVFQALGKAKEAGVLSIGRQGVFLIPLVILLPSVFVATGPMIFSFLVKYPMENGLYGVMFAQPVADFITLMLSIFMSISAFRMLHDQNQKELMNLEEENGCQSEKNLAQNQENITLQENVPTPTQEGVEETNPITEKL